MANKRYVQKFRKTWLDRDELRDWLVENPNIDDNGKYGGFCIYCCTSLPSKLYDLQSHAASRKHAKNVAEKSKCDPLAVTQVLFTANCFFFRIRVTVFVKVYFLIVQGTGPYLDVCRTVLSVTQPDHIKLDRIEDQSKEDIFGKFIASELKLIKNQKVYEEVKWTIIDTIRNALNRQSETVETRV